MGDNIDRYGAGTHVRMIGQLATAVLVTAAFATLAYLFGMIGLSGAVGGFVVGAVIYLCTGSQGFAALALFVAGGSLLTRLGYEKKRRSGIAQEKGGRRGAKNALANCGVGAVCAVLYAITGYPPLLCAFVASLGAAFADTAESEVGQLYGGRPYLIVGLRRVAPGTDGAVTLAGTAAGLAAAFLMAFLGLALGLIGGVGWASGVAASAFLGTVADSIVGAKIPKLGNEATNLLCTLVAAALALCLA